MARAKNTARAASRRRYRAQQRAVEAEPEVSAEDVAAAATDAPAPRPSLFRVPDVRADFKALPGMFRTKPLLWIPFLMLLVGFAIDLLLRSGTIKDGLAASIGVTYWQLIFHPTGLFVFFIGGFLAPRASWLVGALLGVVDALLLSLGVAISLAAGWAGSSVETSVAPGDVALIWVMAIVLGTLAGAFAAWYRNFLRSSQERARANRLAREREQAAKAKEQARLDKEAARAAATAARRGGTPTKTVTPTTPAATSTTKGKPAG